MELSMNAEFDLLKIARIDTLQAGIDSISWDHTPHGFRWRDAMYQAIADVNLDHITKKTETVIRLAWLLSSQSEHVA